MPETAAKACGTCSMCCKLPSIAELEKPAGVWCQHVLKGKGCGIYEARPEVCRAFRCSWLRDPDSPDSWRPDRCGFMLRRARPKRCGFSAHRLQECRRSRLLSSMVID